MQQNISSGFLNCRLQINCKERNHRSQKINILRTLWLKSFFCIECCRTVEGHNEVVEKILMLVCFFYDSKRALIEKIMRHVTQFLSVKRVYCSEWVEWCSSILSLTHNHSISIIINKKLRASNHNRINSQRHFPLVVEERSHHGLFHSLTTSLLKLIRWF